LGNVYHTTFPLDLRNPRHNGKWLYNTDSGQKFMKEEDKEATDERNDDESGE